MSNNNQRSTIEKPGCSGSDEAPLLSPSFGDWWKNRGAMRAEYLTPARLAEDAYKAALGEEYYPCDDCGFWRTKDEGGTIFTVCDDCWDK